MIRATLLLTGALVVISAILSLLFWSDLSHGMQPIEGSLDYVRFTIIAFATFLGVISNGVYDRLMKGKDAELFKRTDIIFAAVIAPVVILPIYKSMGDMPDPIIVALMSYQNGFFFNVIFDKFRQSEPKPEKVL
ncbi:MULTISPECIES: hypothetical protein [Pseudomonas]|uniref:hypothetical protein n=1 Tax=Pseudomonas TaxID=286 RepID=UPI00235FB56F|nr:MULTISPECIES: hypothetical protein [Pseudomonas]WJV25800.1 hypothetical protein PSR66_07170 [Pseudomonas chlororaphis]